MAVKIFFCYAHEDEAHLNKLKAHLKPLQRQGLIAVWHDRDISAGEEWEQEIKEQLSTAQIILLLVSPDFMNSEYCYSKEMKRGIERHDRKEAIVIPIILRPAYLRGAPFEKLQALPTNAKPVISWSKRDEAYLDITRGVQKAVEELTSDKGQILPIEPTQKLLIENEKTSKRATHILMADDDPQLLRLMGRNLLYEGYEVSLASDGEQALELFKTYLPDLVTLDVMMPKIDGFTVCQRIREFSDVPIIIITVKGQDQDKIRGLDFGADDYLTKPFSVVELLARIRAVLRRGHFTVNERSPQITTIGEITIDYNQLLVIKAGREVPLTPVEYRILASLVQNAGHVVTASMLLEQVWGSEYKGESHMLVINIDRLRRKIEDNPDQPYYILTKKGIGYLFRKAS